MSHPAPSFSPEEVEARAEELIKTFALDCSAEDLFGLAIACQGFADPFNLAAAQVIRRRAEALARTA